MRYVIDGIEYEEYPDEQERIATLREDRDYWKKLAMSQARRIGREEHV